MSEIIQDPYVAPHCIERFIERIMDLPYERIFYLFKHNKELRAKILKHGDGIYVLPCLPNVLVVVSENRCVTCFPRHWRREEQIID